MLNLIGGGATLISFLGVLAAFLITVVLLKLLEDKLPRDHGREFAFDGKKSEGKPRGAGIIFVFVFFGVALVFGTVSWEQVIYLLLVVAAMLTGYFDDCSDKPWSEYFKGLLDLIIAIGVAVNFLVNNPNSFYMVSLGREVFIHPIIYGILIVILVWASINVTNCSDGVDGLSGTISIISLGTFFAIDLIRDVNNDFTYSILLFCACLLGYLWYNATPSRMMMGDAGSRAMGLVIALAALKSGCPLLYLLAAIVLILDGGLGLIKVSLLRFCKIKILVNIRTPLHDHFRKNKGWSNTQTVSRFAIIQAAISVCVVYIVLLCK